MAKLEQALLSRQQIRDEMVNALQDGRAFPKPMQQEVRELGITASSDPTSVISTFVDVFSDVAFQMCLQQLELAKMDIKEKSEEE